MTIIQKSEIQKGDRIRVTIKRRGTTVIRAGIAHKADKDGDWLTEEGGFLTFDGWGEDSFEVKLLERPMPAEPGTVFVATKVRGRSTRVKTFVAKDVNGQIRYFTEAPVQGSFVHAGDQITAWELLDA